MGKPIRILQVVGTMRRAGIETLLMNLYRNMDREKVQFDFLTHRRESGDYDEEIKKLGGKMYYFRPLRPWSVPMYLNEVLALLREHGEYKLVHSHIDALSTFPLWAAKKTGTPIRIAHSHNTSLPKDAGYPLRLVARHFLSGMATDFFACSVPAAEYMFSGKVARKKQYTVLNNAVDVERLRYNPERRAAERAGLGIGNEFVIGHTGRFEAQKNHGKLLEIFRAVHDIYPDSVLLMVGEGSLQKEARAKADALGIRDCVRFLGSRSDIPELLQAMDIFVLPSLYEGFSVAGVEAQAAGLPCVFSDTIRWDNKLVPEVSFVPLTAAPEDWAEKLLSYRERERTDNARLLIEQGFDIHTQAQQMQRYYLERIEGLNK